MKKLIMIAAMSALATTSISAFAATTTAHTGGGAKAKLIDAAGAEIGVAHLTQGPSGVLIHVKVSGLKPGAHGLHLHTLGVCETGEGFKTAKGHVGTVEGGHGLLNPKGPEPGDLPNIFVGADGKGEMEAFTSLVSLSDGAHPLLDQDGSSFIIHENADDHLTQPIGGAGGRVACGIIEKH